MTRYWLRLHPEQPLRLANAATIPASTLRGAIAAVALSACAPGHEHDLGPCSAGCRYWSLFGEGATLRIGPAYAGAGDETQPFLATARTCSQSSGFTAAGGHGVFDVAIRQWVFEQTCRDPQRLLAPFTLRCPACDAPLIPCEGLATRLGEREYETVGDAATPITLSHAIQGRVRPFITERYAVSAQLINRGMYYTARVDVPERLDGLLRDVIAGGLWIGGRRSRGMGAVRTELVPYTVHEPPLVERIAHFNRAVRTEHRFYMAMDVAHLADDEGESYFTLDLHSPSLPAYESTPSIVPALAALPGVIPIRQWLSSQTVEGWHSAAGLPRRTAIGTTGVILYKVPPEANRANIAEVLAFLEVEGVGTGRERGFGSVTICDPFHLLVDLL
ncbi:MAG: hypothetical protein IT324_04765 [Anaerolineae bacterium]|nr:hypothetical protein [Anaerolineae bacterium]